MVTEWVYSVAVSDPIDRRANQKARTRATIRAAAHEMFAAAGFDATTIVDIAARAGVSVQTVFNHFTSKEELFFADRAHWVEGPAAAVRDHPPGVPVTSALRRHLVASVEGYARAASEPRHQRMMEVLEATPALQTFERNLHEETVAKLAEALAAACAASHCDADACSPLLTEVTASVWMAAVRAIVLDLRSDLHAIDEAAVQSAVQLTDRVLRDLEAGLSFAPVEVRTARAS
jgi:AcrR family transcriptional regulator